MTVVLVPVFNVDGHERFGKNHRPNQRGPEEMGFRVTAQNLNLNREAAAHGTQWRAAMRQADGERAQRHVLAWDSTKVTQPIVFKGYAYTREASAVSGKAWIRYDEATPQDWTVPLASGLSPSLTVDAPGGGWLVLPAYAQRVGLKLSLHGLRFRRLAQALPETAVEEFRAQSVTFEAGPAARLEFFSSKHPSFDARLNLLPVYRLDRPVL